MVLRTQVFRIHNIILRYFYEKTNQWRHLLSIDSRAWGIRHEKRALRNLERVFASFGNNNMAANVGFTRDNLTLKFSVTRLKNSLTAVVSKQGAVESLKLCKLLLCLPRETFLFNYCGVIQFFFALVDCCKNLYFNLLSHLVPYLALLNIQMLIILEAKLKEYF